ncbi:unnamed protein product (mitochondrion) [Plasmodiophora brassicae]|uniref:Ion transport domain-containing protein n=1 Tax=Plasmodiophora brassicae TaxID=37360 RepID=A0A3P3Y716_PLABS|nr:unnamed protein product [Plasmodiophora brassicae]
MPRQEHVVLVKPHRPLSFAPVPEHADEGDERPVLGHAKTVGETPGMQRQRLSGSMSSGAGASVRPALTRPASMGRKARSPLEIRQTWRRIAHDYADRCERRHQVRAPHHHQQQQQQHPELMPALMARISAQRALERTQQYVTLPGVRVWIWNATNNAGSSIYALCFTYVSMAVIVVSVVSACVGSMANVATSPAWYFWMELACTAMFTFELGLHAVTCRTPAEIFQSKMNMIDLIVIVPFYVELGLDSIALQSVTQSTAFVCLRSLRVLRIVKLMRHLAWVPMLSAVLMKSRLPLAIMGFIFGIATLTLASMMYLAENAPGSDFVSIPTSLYFTVITSTTVGYGDIVPVTGWGKLVAAIAVLVGILMLAIPISIVSDAFHTRYAARNNVVTFVERYRRKQRNKSPTFQERLQWTIHRVHEESAFNLMAAVHEQLKVPDQRNIDDDVYAFVSRRFDVENVAHS